MPMTRFLTLFDTVVTDPLEDIPTVNELEKWLKNVGEQAFYFLIRLAAAGLLLFIGSKLIKFLMNRFKRSKLYQKMDPGFASFMASGSRIVLYIILILMCFGVLGIETASFLALFTSGGVAIGLAFQGAVTNLAGGVMILLFHPFRVGDYIETTEIAGTVNAISVLYTVVLTPDNKRVTVPNGSLTNAAITNYSAVGQRRVELTFSVSYDCDIDKVKQILLSVAESDPKSLKDPAPLARLKTQSASSLDFVLRVWCAPENYWDLYFDLNENVKKALDEAGMEIPFPQMDVHMR